MEFVNLEIVISNGIFQTMCMYVYVMYIPQENATCHSFFPGWKVLGIIVLAFFHILSLCPKM